MPDVTHQTIYQQWLSQPARAFVGGYEVNILEYLPDHRVKVQYLESGVIAVVHYSEVVTQ